MFLSFVTLASEVVFLKMPSRNQKKRSKQRAEYLQKQDENKAKARALYKADSDKKKASVRDSYKADIESKRSAKRRRYEEDLEENRAAKRRRYEEDLEENRAGDMKRTSRRTVLLKGGDMKRTSALLKGRNTRTIQLPLKHLKGVGIGMTLLSDWLKVLPRGPEDAVPQGSQNYHYHPKVCYGMLY